MTVSRLFPRRDSQSGSPPELFTSCAHLGRAAYCNDLMYIQDQHWGASIYIRVRLDRKTLWGLSAIYCGGVCAHVCSVIVRHVCILWASACVPVCVFYSSVLMSHARILTRRRRLSCKNTHLPHYLTKQGPECCRANAVMSRFALMQLRPAGEHKLDSWKVWITPLQYHIYSHTLPSLPPFTSQCARLCLASITVINTEQSFSFRLWFFISL